MGRRARAVERVVSSVLGKVFKLTLDVDVERELVSWTGRRVVGAR